MLGKQAPYILSLANIKDKDFELVGREGLIYSYIYKAGIPVVPGFVITTVAFDDFLTAGDLIQPVSNALRSVRPFINQSAKDAHSRISNVILSSKIPSILERPIVEAYRSLNSIGDLPLAQIDISNIMQENFIYKDENMPDTSIKGIFGVNTLLYQIKSTWLNLFSTEAIEHRVNNYYAGPLTMAVMVKKAVRGELTGKAYNFTLGTKSRDAYTIKSIYGMDLTDSEFEQYCDIYSFDVKANKIKEKFVRPQKDMYVRKGKLIQDEEPNIRVRISDNWQSRQKVTDDRIMRIAEIVSKLDDMYEEPLEVSWAIDSGEVLVVNVKIVDINKYIESESKPTADSLQPTAQVDQKPNIKELTKEVEAIVNGEVAAELEVINDKLQVISEEIQEEEPPKREITLTELRKRTQLDDANPKWFEAYKLKTEILLDMSKITSARIAAIENFDGAYFDGTEMILNNNMLPEEFSENTLRLNELADKYALDISSASKTVDMKSFIYSFSNVTDYERKLLGVDEGKFKFSGDERFIDSPEVLATEVVAIKKAKTTFDCRNISITIPSIRNLDNLKDIKKILNAQGLRDSHYLKLYGEVSVPAFIFELNKLEKDDLNGLIFDFRALLTLSVYRTEPREADYVALFEQLKFVAEIANRKHLELFIKLDNNLSPELMENIIKLQPKGLIFENIPEEKTIKLISKVEEGFKK
jgi:pyruvate,water dikinase